jgi:hypothetical protein
VGRTPIAQPSIFRKPLPELAAPFVEPRGRQPSVSARIMGSEIKCQLKQAARLPVSPERLLPQQVWAAKRKLIASNLVNSSLISRRETASMRRNGKQAASHFAARPHPLIYKGLCGVSPRARSGLPWTKALHCSTLSGSVGAGPSRVTAWARSKSATVRYLPAQNRVLTGYIRGERLPC